MAGLLGSVLILLVLGLCFWYFQTKSKRDEAALSQMARERGWSYERQTELASLGSPGVLRHHFSHAGAGDISWTLDIQSVSSGAAGGSAQSTTWRTEAIRPQDELVLIGPRPPGAPAGIDFGGALAQMALQLMLRAAVGEDAPSTERLHECQIGSGDHSRHYMTFTTDESAARRLLSAQAEAALVELAGYLKESERPAVVFWPRGLQIRSSSLITKPETLDRIVSLGQTLAASWSAHK